MTSRSSRSDVPLQDWHDREPKDSKAVEVHVQEQRPDPAAETYWRPGVKSQFPWVGLGALLTMLLCAASTIVILKTSNNKLAEQWPAYQQYDWIKESWKEAAQLTPSTALALVNTVYNVALAVAIGNGVIIAWWRKALHGATVQDLHKSWAYSTSIWELVTAGKSFNLIALCALTAKLALVDNILLQQAASNRPGYLVQTVNDLRFPIARELPPNFLGTWSDDGSSGSLSATFSKDLYAHFRSSERFDMSTYYEADAASVQFDTRCRGECFFNVDGFGVNVSCSEGIVLSTYEVAPENLAQSQASADGNQTGTGVQDTNPILMRTSFKYWAAGAEEVEYPDPWIEMTLDYATITSNGTSLNPDGDMLTPATQTCGGQLTRLTCAIRPALVKYYLVVTNITQTGATGNGVSGSGNGVLSPAYQTNSSKYNDVIHSLFKFVSNSFTTTVNLNYFNNTGFAPQSYSGGYIGQFLAQATALHQFPSSCVFTMVNPTSWLQQQLDGILLRASVSAAANNPQDSTNSGALKAVNPDHVLQNLTGTRYTGTVQFVSLYAWMAGALSVMAICITCVLPTYWGYWELGRRVTLGPMEIASAFQAPALKSSVVAAGGEVEQMLKEVGQREVRYGVVVGSGSLAMAEASKTVQLKPGAPIRTAGDW